jgi:hypothetical protein
MLAILFALSVFSVPSGANQSGGTSAVQFSDVSAAVGLAVIDPGPVTDWAAYGPGVAWGDYDGDGDLDVFVTARFDQLGFETEGDKRVQLGLGPDEEPDELQQAAIDAAVDAGAVGRTHLMRNDNGIFTDVTAEAGVLITESSAIGASWADYDGDGDLDLYISNFGFANFDNVTDGTAGEDNIMFANNGDGTFTDVTTLSRLGNPGHSSNGLWADYDHDGDLDLYSLNVGIVDERDFQVRSETNILYRNDGDSDGDGVPEFSDQTIEAGRVSGQDLNPSEDYIPSLGEEITIHGAAPAGPSAQVIIQGGLGLSGAGTGISWAGIWFDYNNDGWEDLFIASDFGVSPLYENNGDGTFSIVTSDVGMIHPGTGMGTHAADYDGDGDFDLCQTNFGPNYIWRNDGGSFEKLSDADIHLDDNKTAVVNWDCHWLDYDLDGDVDLFYGGGRINTFISVQENTLFRNDGDGVFTDVTLEVGLGGHDKVMGASMADFDGDGDIDIMLGISDGPLKLMMNNAAQVTGNDYLKVKLNGVYSNTNGIGVLVEVELVGGQVLMQRPYAGEGFLGSSDSKVHFGLGPDAEIHQVRVHWSTGHIQVIEDVEVNGILSVDEEPPLGVGSELLSKILVGGFLVLFVLLGILSYKAPGRAAAPGKTAAPDKPEDSE